MYPTYYYYDIVGLLITLPVFIFALYAQNRVRNTYQKYSNVRSGRGFTGYDTARSILDGAGLRNVRVEMVEGHLSDHYDPRTNVVRLSRDVYCSPTISAAGIAAHECGHAIQHAEKYIPITIRGMIVPVTNLGSSLAIPLLFIGFLMGSTILVTIGIIGYALAALFQMLTLPVEFNASSRALSIIQDSYILENEELKGARNVLNAAALTYVAALASSVAQLLRLILLSNRRRR